MPIGSGPGTDNYCCDVSDCRRTEAEWRHDQWWAIVQGVWMPIPRDKELTVNSIDGYAYVCSGWARVIFYFIPPNSRQLGDHALLSAVAL